MVDIWSEGLVVSSPVREGGVNTTVVAERRRCATFLCRPFGPLSYRKGAPRPYGRGY
jgi:hypothetical protein